MKKCIVCGAPLFEEPLIKCTNFPASAQGMPSKDDLVREKGIDINLCQCKGCGLVQYDCTPVNYYRDVIRAGGYTTTMVELRKKQYSYFIGKYGLNDKKIIEVGCGRGEFLKILQAFPVKVYGIENNPQLVKFAQENGLNVEENFAEDKNSVLKNAPFDAFLSFNFLEHQPNPNDMMQCIYQNLSDDGYGLITVPDWNYILRNGSYYELLRDHIAYYTTETLSYLMERNGFRVLESRIVNNDTIEAIVRKKKQTDITTITTNYDCLKSVLAGFLDEETTAGRRVAIWGAGHQGFTTLSSMGISDRIAYIIDSAPFKQGKFSPASHLPIVSPDYYFVDPVQTILVIAPGYTDEIVRTIKHKFGTEIKISALKDGVFYADYTNAPEGSEMTCTQIKKVVITGATGFLGSAITRMLIAQNIIVVALVRKGSSKMFRLPSSELIKVIECNADALNELEPVENDCDVFFHLAWETERSTHDDLQLQLRNVNYTMDAIFLAKRMGCKKFIGAGSQAEYGTRNQPLTSITPVHPQNGYGIGKLSAGYFGKEYAAQLNIGFNWVRILSLYGPGDSSQTMLSTAINHFILGQKSRFTKGEQLWDYLYVDDAARAFLAIAEKGIDGKTYVLGSGCARPLAEYIYILAKKMKAESLVEIGALPYAENQVMNLCADISELTKDTGWKPETTFEKGIEITIKHIERGGVY